jgi:hypothetical protein
MHPRWRFWTSAAVLAGACFAYYVSASAEWADRAAMVGTNPTEAAEQASFVAEMYAVVVLSVVGWLAFLVTRSVRGWLLAAGVQVAVFVVAIIEGTLINPDDIGWFFFSTIPLVTMVLLFAIRALPPKPESAGTARLDPSLTD